MTMTKRDSPWKNTIGIVGGLGPYAHLALERYLLEACSVKTEQEYPPWVVVSTPDVPDRTRCIVAGSASPTDGLVAALHRLKCAGADFALIACNTAHYFLPQLNSPIPILDIIAEVLCDVQRRLGTDGSVGLLATTGTLQSAIYQQTAKRLGCRLKLLTPLDLECGRDVQNQVMAAIYGDVTHQGIKQGQQDTSNVTALRTAADRLAEAGAKLIIMGCTEIPLVLAAMPLSVPLVDPLVIAAREALACARGQRAADRWAGI